MQRINQQKRQSENISVAYELQDYDILVESFSKIEVIPSILISKYGALLFDDSLKFGIVEIAFVDCIQMQLSYPFELADLVQMRALKEELLYRFEAAVDKIAVVAVD